MSEVSNLLRAILGTLRDIRIGISSGPVGSYRSAKAVGLHGVLIRFTKPIPIGGDPEADEVQDIAWSYPSCIDFVILGDTQGKAIFEDRSDADAFLAEAQTMPGVASAQYRQGKSLDTKAYATISEIPEDVIARMCADYGVETIQDLWQGLMEGHIDFPGNANTSYNDIEGEALQQLLEMAEHYKSLDTKGSSCLIQDVANPSLVLVRYASREPLNDAIDEVQRIAERYGACIAEMGTDWTVYEFPDEASASAFVSEADQVRGSDAEMRALIQEQGPGPEYIT